MTLTFSPFRLRRLRMAKGLTQVELARRVGLSKLTIVTYERAGCDPSAAALGRLAGALNCDIGELFAVRERDAA